MKILFQNPKHEAMVNSDNPEPLDKWCVKQKTGATGNDVRETLADMAAAASSYNLPTVPYHSHPLKDNYKGCFGVWLNGHKRARLIFKPVSDGPDFRIDNYKTITVVEVIELNKDYHKK